MINSKRTNHDTYSL